MTPPSRTGERQRSAL
ncbi:MAG: hypothetical protein IKF45_05280 [Lachnospiraceae bacterium]|nr:hypothetical protein [Lachnospiraceae bacterium]MBR3308842.1 hypothetical protein [Lachnospiraceae bacterium]